MPVSKFLPYQWYDTPNIHFCTVKDFEALCQDKGIRILDRAVVNTRNQTSKIFTDLMSFTHGLSLLGEEVPVIGNFIDGARA